MKKTLIELLKANFTYNPETGELHWKSSGCGRRKDLIAGSVVTRRGTPFKKVCVQGYEVSAAKTAWILMTGEYPLTRIRHIDGDTLNLKWNNLAPSDLTKFAKGCKTPRRKRTDIDALKARWFGSNNIRRDCL